MRRIPLFALLAVAGISAPAGADWKKTATTDSSDYLMAFTRFAGKQLLVGGMRLKNSGGIPQIGGVLHWSQDSGATFQQVTAIPGGGGLITAAIEDLFAVDAKNLYAISGDSVHFANNVGAPWKAKKLGGSPARIRMFDAATGVIVGGNDQQEGMSWRTEDAGATWTEVPTGTEGTLSTMFWLDAKRGFAAGAWTTEEDPQNTGQMQTTYHESAFLATADGGKTWTHVSSPTDGHFPGPIFFLDASRGFFATAEWTPDMGRAGPAHLWKTTDGGKTFTDMNLPVNVGKGFMGMPVTVSYISVMYWSDEQNGHLGGDCYVMDTSSGGGSSTPPVYKLADYLTHDGGQTWTHTDIGTLSIDLGGGGLPPTDGRIMGGELFSMAEGFMIGETGAVYSYEYKCQTHEDCGYGYACGAGSKCVPILIPDTCSGSSCDDRDVPATGEPIVLDDGDVIYPVVECGEGGCGQGAASGGCTAGQESPAAASLALFALLAVAGRWRRPGR
jgi:hypothetical protein